MRIIVLTILFLFVFVTSCEKKNDTKTIYNIVLNRLIKPLPPPSLDKLQNLEIKQKVIDSINKVSMKISVYPYKYKFNEENFNSIREGSSNYYISTEEINEKNIEARSSISFSLLNKGKLNDKISIYKEYDGILYLSDIIYNSEKTKAVLIVGYSIGKLSSETSIFYLEKKETKWSILERKRLSFS